MKEAASQSPLWSPGSANQFDWALADMDAMSVGLKGIVQEEQDQAENKGQPQPGPARET